MRVTASLRTLNTPQTKKNGQPLKNQWGHDLYTQYLQCSDMKQILIKEHMRKELTKIKRTIDELGEMMFLAGTGIDIHEKKQKNDEPIKYSFIERLDMVLARSKELNKQNTMGIIDMYNEVIKSTYKGLGTDAEELAEKCIVIDDPDIESAKHIVFSKLFKFSKDTD